MEINNVTKQTELRVVNCWWGDENVWNSVTDS